MATHVHDQDALDALVTERSDGVGAMLDTMSTTDLVALMNDRDAQVTDAVRAELPVIAAAIDATAARMSQGGRLVYVGAGTSGRLGVLDASEIPPTFGTSGDVVVGIIAGGPTAIVSAVEAAEDDPEAGARDLDALGIGPLDTVVGIASSGRTPYVLGALARANTVGALTVGLSCNTGTPVSAAARFGIELAVGAEVVTGSTRLRAGTATKMVLNMMSTVVMIRRGKTYGTLMVDMRATNDKLRRRAIRIVGTATGADETASESALASSDWHAKTAIAMIALGVDAAAARTALEQADGFLGRVLDDQGTER